MFEDAARVRAKEAKTLETSGLLCGAVYLAGYVIECRLKTLLHKQGKRFPRSGAEGHNLQGLWNSAGLRVQDLRGHRKLFMDTWSVSIRYEASLPTDIDAYGLLEGARDLASIVSIRIRRIKGKRRNG